MEHIVGLGECVISNNTEDVLKTYALNTCIGITVYCPVKKVMALAHVVLPNSNIIEHKEKIDEMRYADTAVVALFKKLAKEYGCRSSRSFVVRLYGGNNSKKDSFMIGHKNLISVKEQLDRLNLVYDASETGGNVIRTLISYVDTGEIELIKRVI